MIFGFLKLSPILYALIFIVLCSGCGGPQKNETVKELNSQLEQLSNSVTDYVKTAEAPEELKKLQQYEYSLVQLPVKSAPEEIEHKLNELGKARWDCFHIEKNDDGQFTFYLKRRPDTPLKYVPRGFIGGGG